MNLYIISQDIDRSWKTFRCAIVCAQNEDEAKKIHPFGKGIVENGKGLDDNGWVRLDSIQVKLLGIAAPEIESGVVCGRMNTA